MWQANQSLAVAVILHTLLAFVLHGHASALVNPEIHTVASPENLVIEITDRQVTTEQSIERIWLRARILAVQASEARLKAGDEIEIIYRRDLNRLNEIEAWFEQKSREPGWAGETPPFSPAAPAQGQRVRAFLRAKTAAGGGGFEPAANQYSFEPLTFPRD